MGPVDLMDQTNKHGTLVKSRKYWKVPITLSLSPRNTSNFQVLFHWCIDVAVSNAWRVHQAAWPKVTRRGFVAALIAGLAHRDGSTTYACRTHPSLLVLIVRTLKRSRSVSSKFVSLDGRQHPPGDFRSKDVKQLAIYVAKEPGSHLPKYVPDRKRCRVCAYPSHNICTHCTTSLSMRVYLCIGSKNCFFHYHTDTE